MLRAIRLAVTEHTRVGHCCAHHDNVSKKLPLQLPGDEEQPESSTYFDDVSLRLDEYHTIQ